MIDIDLLLTWGATYKKLDRAEIVFREGDQCQFYFQLVSGRVSWMNIDENGKEFIQTMIDPGESFGELPLFDDEPYVASAIADEPSLIIRLCKSNFLQLLKENPAIHFSFSRILSKRARLKFLLIKTFANQVPDIRIMALLQYFKKEHKHICSNCNQLMLTRQQIADMTGLRVETVIRSIKHMHEKGELTIEKGKVYCGGMIPIIK